MVNIRLVEWDHLSCKYILEIQIGLFSYKYKEFTTEDFTYD